MYPSNVITVALSASALFIKIALADHSHSHHPRHAQPDGATSPSSDPSSASVASSSFWSSGSGATAAPAPISAAVSSAVAPASSAPASSAPASSPPASSAANPPGATPSAEAVSSGTGAPPASGTLTPEQLIRIAPSTQSCAGAKNLTQCRNATQAAGPIQKSFETYGITHSSVKAALIADMLYESEKFVFYQPEVPKPGVFQGCRNMMMPQWTLPYAQGLNMTQTQAFIDDDASFGAAAWYITNNTGACPLRIRQALWGGDKDQLGFQDYVYNCLDTKNLTERRTFFDAAMAVLGYD